MIEKALPNHGTRPRYVTYKCRCGACRAANTVYAAARNARLIDLAKIHDVMPSLGIVSCVMPNGKIIARKVRLCPGADGTGCPKGAYLKSNSKGNVCQDCREGLIRRYTLVPATAAQAHLHHLSSMGLGLKSVAFIAELNRSELRKIRKGIRKNIDPDTSAAILEVETPKYPLNPNGLVCRVCEQSHRLPARLVWLKSHLPSTLEDLTNAKPCVYGIEKGVQSNRSKGRRYLYRDLTSVGAKPLSKDDDDRPIWGIPKGSQ